ncbi:MAG: hypothetical protein Q4G28_00115 [Neisseria sp.]|nr:hypothetical protein [Neisseria sp.]
MQRILTSLPVWVVLADMVYGFVLNILQSLNLTEANLPKDGLPVSPDIAFSGLQVLANGGMIAIIGFGLLVLLQLNRTVLQGKILTIGVFRALGLLAVLAFSLPSLWEWSWALLRFAGGGDTIAFGNPRYLLVALCQPFIALLCLLRLFGWYRLHQAVAPDGEEMAQ